MATSFTTTIINLLKAFPTGSQVYGIPKGDSDLDLCILVDQETDILLEKFASDTKGDSTTEHGQSYRFGKLNLLTFQDVKAFNHWKKVTDELIARKPVTRDEAIAAFQAIKTTHDEPTEIKKGYVILNLEGNKYVYRGKEPGTLLEGEKIIATRPHGESVPDLSYTCGSPYCRCMD